MDLYKIAIPRQGRKWRIVECVKRPSAKGNLMLEIDVELIDNAPIEVIDPDTGSPVSVDINGISIRHWVTLTPNNLDRANQWNKCHELPTFKSLEEMEAADPNLYKGKIGYGITFGAEKNQEDANGQVIKNLRTGAPMTMIERRIGDLMLP